MFYFSRAINAHTTKNKMNDATSWSFYGILFNQTKWSSIGRCFIAKMFRQMEKQRMVSDGLPV